MSLQNEQRRFERIDHVSPKQIIRLNQNQSFENVILTKNLSASGLQFNTTEPLTVGSYFLLYLNSVLLQEMNLASDLFLKTGDHHLAKVVRSQKQESLSYDIGAAFIEKNKSTTEDLSVFTELLNVKTLNEMRAVNP